MRIAAMARLRSSRSPNAREMAPFTSSSAAASARSSADERDGAHAAALCGVARARGAGKQQARMREPLDLRRGRG